MATTEGEASVVFKFGGGIHSRASEEDIDVRECSDGENFDLDLQNFHLRSRKPFKKLGTAPNGQEIRGFISLKDSSGVVSLAVQAGDTVYRWTGTGFTTIGGTPTVDANARLRGRIATNYLLDDICIVTDLSLIEPVKEWTGQILSDVAFTDEVGGSASPFKAKYCVIRGERAIYGNIEDRLAVKVPHMMVGSRVSDYKNITVANLPSSALGEDDPFYLLTPDLRQVNALVSSFGLIELSTKDGSIFKAIGNSSKDFQFSELYPESAVSGNEAMAYIGNDIMYGRPGVLESLARSDKFGDVESDDLSVGISDRIDGYVDWTIVYNKRTKRVYCYSDQTSEIWVLYKPLVGSEISPWMKMTTQHGMNMNPTAIMNAYDPATGLEEIFFGDSTGNLYLMDGGDAISGDGGTNAIRVSRKSKMISIPDNAQSMDIQGWIKYRKLQDVIVTLKFLFQGENIYSTTITQRLYPPEGIYFGGNNYFGGNFYFGSAKQRIGREVIGVPGKSNDFQVEIIIDDKNEFSMRI